jgi:hypothetical protein
MAARRHSLLLLVAPVALIVCAAACSDSKKSSASQSTTAASTSAPVAGLPSEPPAAPAETHGLVQVPSFPLSVRYEGTEDVRKQQLVTLTVGRVVEGQPFFEPTILEGSSNQSVTLRLSNTTPTTHNFTLEAEHIDTSIPAGATVDITVQFPTTGALIFYCKLHGNEDHGGGLYTIA